MAHSTTRLGLVLLGALGALVLTEGTARSQSRSEIRAARRCERAIVREGMVYAHRVESQVARCLSLLNRCSRESTIPSFFCGAAERTCTALPASMDAHLQRLQGNVGFACDEIGLDYVLADLGYFAQLGCEVESLEDLADCLAASLRLAAVDDLNTLLPGACDAVTAADMTDLIPMDLCSAGESDPEDPEAEGDDDEPVDPDEPQGPLFCGGAGEIACPGNFLCDRIDTLCVLTDAPGMCVPVPDQPCLVTGNPVCGCDGITYPSDCDRLLSGMARAHDGPCGSGGE
jgi:hypothetical protein